MSPLGLVAHFFIISSLISVFVGCAPKTSPTNCPNDWSLEPTSSSDTSTTVIHCWDPNSTTSSSCTKSSCQNFPVCTACTDVATGENVSEVECSNEFHLRDDGNLQSICIDKDERFLTCSGLCRGSLSCTQCTPSEGNTLQRRGNPFSASMYSSSSMRSNGGFFGENFNLRS